MEAKSFGNAFGAGASAGTVRAYKGREKCWAPTKEVKTQRERRRRRQKNLLDMVGVDGLMKSIGFEANRDFFSA